MEAQSSVKQQVLMLIPQGCSLCQVMEASAEILPCQQMHYQMLLGLITPSCMLLAGITVFEGNIDSPTSLKIHCSDESGGILPSQLLVGHRLAIQLWKGPRSGGSEDAKRHSNSCVCKPKATLHKQVEHR